MHINSNALLQIMMQLKHDNTFLFYHLEKQKRFFTSSIGLSIARYKSDEINASLIKN